MLVRAVYLFTLSVFCKCLKSFFSFLPLSNEARLLFSKERVWDYSKRKKATVECPTSVRAWKVNYVQR